MGTVPAKRGPLAPMQTRRLANNRAYNLASASSRVEQQAAELTWQHATGKGSSIAKT